MLLINESGLYNAIFNSTLPNAKRFKRWVTSEVLPSIRKTGSYITPMTNEQIVQKALLIVNAELNHVKQELAEAKPLADYTTKVLDTSSCFTTTDIAKSMGMSAQQLNKLLAKKKIQYKYGDSWYLYSPYQGLGLTKTATFLVHENDDISYTAHSMKWTEKGRKFIYDVLQNKLQLQSYK